jgi:hypothetical protein
MHRIENKCIERVSENPEGKRLLGDQRVKLRVILKTYLKTGREIVDWI